MRNVEAAAQATGNLPFAVLLIAEEPVDPVTSETWEQSLPHLSPVHREALMRAYLGCVSWEDVCLAVGLDFNCLPETVADVATSSVRKANYSKLKQIETLLGKDTCQVRIDGRGERGRRWNVVRIDDLSGTVDLISDDGELTETGVSFDRLVISAHSAPIVTRL